MVASGLPVFAQLTAEYPYSLQWVAPVLLKIAPSRGGGGCEPPSNTWFPKPTRAHNPNGISIDLAVCAGLKTVSDQQIDRQTTLLGL